MAQTATTTTVASQSNPSTYGADSTFSVCVRVGGSLGGATGTATCYDGANSFGSVAVRASSCSACPAPSPPLTAGSHSISAVYSGGGSFAGSTSAPITQYVNKVATRICLGPSYSCLPDSGTAEYGTPYTIIAAISGMGSGCIQTGSVTVYDGSTLLATVATGGALFGGTCGASGTYTTGAKDLAIGSHMLSAQYSGDSNNLASYSTGLTVTVSLVLKNLVITGAARVVGGKDSIYAATAYWSDGTSTVVTPDSWSVDSTVDTLSPFFEGEALSTKIVQADKVDTITATYTFGGVTKTATFAVTVAAKILDLLFVTCASPVLGGESTACTANAHWNDFSITDVTGATIWTVTPPTYAAISAVGVVTTSLVPTDQTIAATGSYTFNGITRSDSTTILIKLAIPPLKSLAIAGPSHLAGGTSASFAATASFTDGSTAPVTATWTVSPATHASVSAAGLLTTTSVTGDATVTVTASYTAAGVTKIATQTVTITAKGGGCASAADHSALFGVALLFWRALRRPAPRPS